MLQGNKQETHFVLTDNLINWFHYPFSNCILFGSVCRGEQNPCDPQNCKLSRRREITGGCNIFSLGRGGDVSGILSRSAAFASPQVGERAFSYNNHLFRRKGNVCPLGAKPHICGRSDLPFGAAPALLLLKTFKAGDKCDNMVSLLGFLPASAAHAGLTRLACIRVDVSTNHAKQFLEEACPLIKHVWPISEIKLGSHEYLLQRKYPFQLIVKLRKKTQNYEEQVSKINLWQAPCNISQELQRLNLPSGISISSLHFTSNIFVGHR